ncbi:MAG: hypothetical protein U0V49_03855 [Saprospiraceae bacterium]
MKKFILPLVTIILLVYSIKAQTNEFLPLSRYGFGSMTRTYSPFSQACGHAGSAYTQIDEFNPLNPATLGFLKVTDAEIGYNIKYKSIRDNQTSINDLSGTLSYIQIGIPLRNSINQLLERKEYKHTYGLSFGIMPVSSTSYNYQVNDSNTVGATVRKLTGSGGLNQFMVGFGYRYKKISAGLNLAYIFGNLKFEQVFYLRDQFPGAKDYYTDRYFGSGFRPQIGFIYQEILNSAEFKKDATKHGKSLNVSLVISAPSSLRMNQYSIHYAELLLGNVATIIDTLSFKENNLTNSTLPLELTAGLSYNHKDHYGAVVDYALQNWSSATLYEGAKGNFINESRISGGLWLRPEQNGFGSILKRSQYRVGAFYESGYLKVKNEILQQYGLTLGMSSTFAFQRQSGTINLGLEFGKMSVSNLINEDYFKVNLGVRLNDNEWFLKRRYD